MISPNMAWDEMNCINSQDDNKEGRKEEEEEKIYMLLIFKDGIKI